MKYSPDTDRITWADWVVAAVIFALMFWGLSW
jgi:hypothetical protein